MKTCPRCGYKTDNDNAKFCYRCGEKMPEAYNYAANQPKTDENRTSEPIDDDGGIILGDTHTSNINQTPPPVPDAHYPYNRYEPPYIPQKKKSGFNWAILILLIPIILALVLIGIFAISGSGGESKEDDVAYNDTTISLRYADMETIVEKAKSEGAGWTEEQWKDAFRDMTKVNIPMHEEQVEILEECEVLEGKSEAERAAATPELEKKAEKFNLKYDDLEKLNKEFQKAAEATEIGGKVIKDGEFARQCFKEIGKEDLFEKLLVLTNPLL